MNIKQSFMIGSCVVSMGWSWLAFAEVAGHVMFVSGKVQVEDAKGQLMPVSTGQAIDVGQRLITQEGGYAHLKMVDDAFYSLRPNSRFLIEAYRYDAEQPSNNRVKTQLESGSVRAITGKAGESHKQGYRLNTPVAAIGVRGTDYIVHHSSEATRVAVSSGAVVVSTFNEQCTAAGVGACAGEAALLLAANLTGDYIEVRADQRLPERKQEQWAPQAAKPATLNEPIATNNDDNRTTQTAANTTVKAQLQKPLEPSAFTWGRWQDEATQSTFRDPNLTIRGLNVGYWLAQANDTMAKGYPEVNRVDFSLAQSEAALRNHDGSWQTAQVSQGQLGVDFSQGSFTTQLAGHYGEQQQPWQLSAMGAVQANGLLVSNPQKSDPTTWVSGAVNATASQAAFAFDKRLAEGALVGITHWRAPQ